MRSTYPLPAASTHEPGRPPTTGEIDIAVRVLRHFVAAGRFGADLDAAGRVLGTLLDALRVAGGGGGDGARAERSWRARWFPSRAEQQRRFEAANTLGLEASCVSDALWEVSHPPLEAAVAYEETGAPPVLLEPDADVRVPLWDAALRCWSASADTHITLQRYTDAAGDDRRITLRIWRTRGVGIGRGALAEHAARDLVEEKLVRTASGDGVDARVVAFRSRRPDGATHYFRVRLSGTGDEFELREMQPVRQGAGEAPAAAALQHEATAACLSGSSER